MVAWPGLFVRQTLTGTLRMTLARGPIESEPRSAPEGTSYSLRRSSLLLKQRLSRLQGCTDHRTRRRTSPSRGWRTYCYLPGGTHGKHIDVSGTVLCGRDWIHPSMTYHAECFILRYFRSNGLPCLSALAGWYRCNICHTMVALIRVRDTRYAYAYRYVGKNR
jgi:hypothetical protein